jgi:hypothetical protein
MGVPGTAFSTVWTIPPSRNPPNSMACSGRSTTTGGIRGKSRRTTSGLGGHTSSKNQEHDGSIPQEIQQLCQSVRHPHVIRQMNVGPPHNTKVLPPNGPIVPMLEQCTWEMFPGLMMQVLKGTCRKGRVNGRLCQRHHQMHQKRCSLLYKSSRHARVPQ